MAVHGTKRSYSGIIVRITRYIYTSITSRIQSGNRFTRILYINVFDCLLDEKGNLKAEYTIEGMHMYANGYAVVLEKLMPYLLEE